MNIADKILQNQDRDGMLRRSLERIIQLYTDKSHFVYELLQNAEDAGATGIRFVQYSDRLEVMHDGKSFTTENLQGLCDIGQSDKINDLNQIAVSASNQSLAYVKRSGCIARRAKRSWQRIAIPSLLRYRTSRSP